MTRFPRRQFGLLKDEEIKSLPRDTVLLLPLGSLEPHGHLPLATDSMLATAILGRVVDATENTWLLPTISIGYLFKYSSWPGAVGIGSEAMYSTVFDVAAALSRDGLDNILTISGHDENREPALLALREARLRFGTRSVYCDWLDLAVSVVRQISASRREGHASEIQTSVFQYLFPDFELELPISDDGREPLPADDDLFVEEELGTWPVDFPRGASCSFTGDPALATAEKGRLVVDHIIERSKRIIDLMREKAR